MNESRFNFDIFKLEERELYALTLLKVMPVLYDLENTTDESKKVKLRNIYYKPKEIKSKWLHEWWKIIEPLFNADGLYKLPNTYSEAKSEFSGIGLQEEKKFLFCIEFYLTQFYKNIPDKKIEYLEKVRMDKHNLDYVLDDMCKILKIEKNVAVDIKKHVSKASTEYFGVIEKVAKVALPATAGALIVGLTAGAAAPAIGALMGAQGLYGAAATASGLAALGGGSLAAGGLGMAGGTAVVVGGGALLGAVGFGSPAALGIQTNKSVSARASIIIETFLVEYILKFKSDASMGKEIYKKVKDNTDILKDLRDDLELENENEELVKYFENFSSSEKGKIFKDLNKDLNASIKIYDMLLDNLRKKVSKHV